MLLHVDIIVDMRMKKSLNYNLAIGYDTRDRYTPLKKGNEMKKSTKAIHKSIMDSQETIDYQVAIPPFKKEEKITQSSKDAKILAKITDWRDDLFGWRQQPVSEAFINNLCEQMIVWINTDHEALLFEEFLHMKKLDDTTYTDWRKKWPDLQRAHEYVLRALGIRREKAALKGEINPTIVAFVQPHYSKVWKDTTEWRSKLKAQEGAEGKDEKTVYILTDKIPNVPEVKDKNGNRDPDTSQ